MLDVPTQWADGGNGRGNYAVANPLDRNSSGTVADGNLKWSAGAAQVCVRGTFAIPSSGKWYMECVVGSASSSVVGVSFGLATANVDLSSSSGATGLYQLYASANRQINLNNSTTGSVSGGFSANDVLQIAVDVDNSKMWLGVNNTWYNSTYTANGDPATGANATSTTSMVGLFPFSNVYSNSVNWNFGQRPFSYTPPTGFKALNTLNLPTPTILKGNQYFDATLWDGNSTNARVITTNVGTVDFAWVKRRNGIDDHRLANTVTGGNRHLKSNATDAESTGTTVIQAFSGSTFTLGTDGSVNATGGTYVGWAWQEGPTQGFDIVTYTGNGTARTISHNLGVAPKMIIVKNRTSGSFGWFVWHTAFGAAGNTDYINLNLADAKGSGGAVSMWNNTMPTSSVFSLGTYGGVNNNANDFVAYLFSEVAGYSRFGSYTGNNSDDGPFVFCGFRPRFVICKDSANTGNWAIFDSARSPFNVQKDFLSAQSSAAENSAANQIDFLSNGFKLRANNANSAQNNLTTSTIIFAAFAEVPFRNSLAR